MLRFTGLLVTLCAVVLLLSLATPALAQEMNGKVQSVDPDWMQVVVKTGTSTMTFNMDEDAQVLINNQPSTLADLQPGDRVTIVHRQEGENMMAIEIRCERN